jgi:hypothetical protein
VLNDDVNRYITLRRTLGYKLVKAGRHLRAFARFAAGRGETHIRTASVLAWIETVSRTPGARARRLTDLILFARGRSPIFTHRTRSPASSMPPASSGIRSPIPCGASSTSCCSV